MSWRPTLVEHEMISEKKESRGGAFVIDIDIELDQCCCTKNSRYLFLDFLVINSTKNRKEGAIIHLNSTIILRHISDFGNRRFKLSYNRTPSRQTQPETSYSKLLCKKV